MKTITVRFAGIEKAPDGNLSIIYIPDQTQVLKAGQKYRIEIEGLSYEESVAKQRSEAER